MTHPYSSAAYAQAFGAGYEPVYLESAKTHILKRQIPGTDYYDAMGVYPVCPLAKTADLEKDFAQLKKLGIVSLVLVTDAFERPEITILQRCFDKAVPFKEHFLHDFAADGTYSKHHRYEVRRANKLVEARVINLAEYIGEWYPLYSTLIEKRGISGIQAFKENYFRALCALEPITIGAFKDGALVSAHIWLEHNGHIYSHLAASSELGYDLGASYAVYDASLKYFAGMKAKVLDLGGGAGAGAASAGLAALKKGFGNTSTDCYLCSKILAADIYKHLSIGKNTAYFPAYRG